MAFFQPPPKRLRSAFLACVCLMGAGSALAGRPLAVDDANVNDPGAGHVEMFYQRLPGSTNAWTVSPAVGVADGIELAASFNRDNTADLKLQLDATVGSMQGETLYSVGLKFIF